MTPILRALTALAAPAGPRSRLSVFYFHRVLEKPDPLLPYEPDARMFDRILGWIGSQFRVLDPVEACDRLFDGSLPSRPAVITFDDGYRDNYTVALPILQRHRMKAAFFVATGFLEGGMMFNDRVIEAVRHSVADRIPLPDCSGSGSALMPLRTLAERWVAIDRILAAVKYLSPDVRDEVVSKLEHEAYGASGKADARAVMMNVEQVVGLHRAGMHIGGHTRTHPILVKLDSDVALREIEGGRDDLAAITGERPVIFAYPNGKRGLDYDSRHVEMVADGGFRYAFTTHAGSGAGTSSCFELPRFTPWGRTALKFGARAYLNLYERLH